jgi:hypothetical protein
LSQWRGHPLHAKREAPEVMAAAAHARRRVTRAVLAAAAAITRRPMGPVP